MSYILDALNKSEEEKKQHKTPGLNTIHLRSDRNSADNNRWLWPTLGFLLVTINLLFVFWFTSDNTPSATSQNTPAVPSGKERRPVEQPERREITSASPNRGTGNAGSTDTAPKPQSNLALQPSPQPAKTSRPGQPEDLLSSNIAINNIKFSSHIYADDSSLRMVVIDGKRFREGDQISKNLKLHAISQDGVIVKHRNQLIPISVLSNWADH
jgi:general secretion pathway protein B